MKYFFLSITILCFSSLSSQGPVITGLKGNAALNASGKNSTAKRAITDTIQLPFLEEFVTSTVYPDMRLWRDSQVYVNSHFAVSPPSYGVATFDNLDKKGKPYQPMSGLQHNHCDSLTSNFINLKNYKFGLNTIDYTIADSIYLSFFYQTQGLGDPLDNTDSLVLKFKDTGGFWKTVWKTSGSSMKPFKQVLIGILNSNYLIPDFQFRFINYGKATGNMNQWHIDYIRMMSGRNRNDTVIADVAINAVPEGPLQWYESMPYDHFKADDNFHTSTFHSVKVRNNYVTPVNVAYKCDIYNTYNQLVLTYPLGSSARNVKNQSDSSENFNQFTFDTLSGKRPSLKLKYTIQPGANDQLPGLYNGMGNNNTITKTVNFRNYFAYDDGSAEGGFGLDYGSLPAGPGYAAVKFKTSKPDTLRGVSIFFNRSVADVSFKGFTLLVWKRLSEPPAPNTQNDLIVKRLDMSTAIYTDSINGFTDIIFDTAVALDNGDFYIGWQQNTNFILNIGYDNNYSFANAGGRNPNLFFNLNGYWEKVNSNITGAVMMRPLVGEKIIVSNPASVKSNSLVKLPKLFPNPAGSGQDINIDHFNRIVMVNVMDYSGKSVAIYSSDDIRTVSAEGISDGIYFLVCTDEYGNSTTQKWIKQSL